LRLYPAVSLKRSIPRNGKIAQPKIIEGTPSKMMGRLQNPSAEYKGSHSPQRPAVLLPQTTLIKTIRIASRFPLERPNKPTTAATP
jgi:hypothetical protein